MIIWKAFYKHLEKCQISMWNDKSFQTDSTQEETQDIWWQIENCENCLRKKILRNKNQKILQEKEMLKNLVISFFLLTQCFGEKFYDSVNDLLEYKFLPHVYLKHLDYIVQKIEIRLSFYCICIIPCRFD